MTTSNQSAIFRQQSQQAFKAAEFYSEAMPSVPVADKRKIGRQVLQSLKLFLAYDIAASTLEARG